MKNNETPPSTLQRRFDFELWFWIRVGGIALGTVSLLDRFLLRKVWSRESKSPRLLTVPLRCCTLGVWKYICVPLWELHPKPIRNRPFSQEASAIFQETTNILCRWNAMFELDCWPDES
jgi:hypothetical protein